MTIADRFATISVIDTNGLLRGQKVYGPDLEGILAHGMGMSAAQLALDPTDIFLDVPGVTDDQADYHDSRLVVDPASRTTIPFEAPQDSGLYLSEFAGDAAIRAGWRVGFVFGSQSAHGRGRRTRRRHRESPSPPATGSGAPLRRGNSDTVRRRS